MVMPQKTVHRAPSVAQKRQQEAGGGAFPASGTGIQRLERRSIARTVGTFVPKLTRTAFEKFGFSTAQLLTDWAQIVGPALADTTSPDRIVWPRRAGHDADEGQRAAPRQGATLHVRVDPARALDVQYKSPLVIDRINAYFGYRAVSELRIVQTPMTPAAPLALVATRTPVAPDPALAGIADDGLRAALERMQSGIVARQR